VTWKKKRKIQGKYENYSLSKKLKKDGKISEQFEIMLNSLTIEELIGLKLELAIKAAGGPLFGLPIYKSLKDVAKAALLMYAASATRTDREAAALLGIDRMEYVQSVKKYKIINYFEGERNGKSTDTNSSCNKD
jgi:hypothetical protein